jgi:hypothetical protein
VRNQARRPRLTAHPRSSDTIQSDSPYTACNQNASLRVSRAREGTYSSRLLDFVNKNINPSPIIGGILPMMLFFVFERISTSPKEANRIQKGIHANKVLGHFTSLLSPSLTQNYLRKIGFGLAFTFWTVGGGGSQLSHKLGPCRRWTS